MKRKKIDPIKLRELLKSGKSAKEAAEYFEVSQAAVSLARRRIDTNVLRLSNLEAAGRILSNELDAAEQMKKISEVNNKVLNLLLRWFEGDDEARKILEGQRSLKRSTFKDPTELLLKVSNQLQGQVELQFKILQGLYDAQQIATFQEEVLSAIQEESPDAKRRIIQRLKEKNALRSSAVGS